MKGKVRKGNEIDEDRKNILIFNLKMMKGKEKRKVGKE